MTTSRTSDSFSLGPDARIRELIDSFLGDLQKGAARRIEDLFDQIAPQHHPQLLLAAVLAEAEFHQWQSIPSEVLETYRLRFPQHPDVISEIASAPDLGWFYLSRAASAPAADDLSSPSPPDQLKLSDPDQFSELTLLGKHYTGGQGTVYRARYRQTAQPAALKVCLRNRSESALDLADRLASLEREINLLNKLRHPGIVRIIGVCRTTDGHPVIIEEWVEGQNLSQYLNNQSESGGRLNPTNAIRILSQILAALRHIHEQNIFHLDLKPGNVMIRQSDQQLVLVDFGMSLESHERSGSQRQGRGGTPSSMAPEQYGPNYNLHWNYQVGARTDIFAVGVILYRMLTGRDPFHRSRAASIGVNAHLLVEHSPPDSPRTFHPDIDAKLSALCLKCLAIDPRDRFSSIQDLLDALNAVNHPDHHRNPHESVSRMLKLLPLQQPDQHFYLGLTTTAGINTPFNQTSSLIQTLSSHHPGTNNIGIIAISAASGAGKSSWFNAAILPGLSEQGSISICRIDAAESDSSPFENTAARLSEQLQLHLSISRHDTTGQPSAADILRQVRDNRLLQPSCKLLLVIDQFEQWLLRYGRDQQSELLSALQLCNGSRVQALLIFREEFLSLAWELLGRCGEQLRDGENTFRLAPLQNSQTAALLLEHILAKSAQLPGSFTPAAQTALSKHIERILSTIPGNQILPVQIVLLARYVLKHFAAPEKLAAVACFEDVMNDHIRDIFEDPHAPLAQHRSLLISIFRRLLPESNTLPRRAEVLEDLFPPSTSSVSSHSGTPHAVLQFLSAAGVLMPVPSSAVAAAAPAPPSWQLTHEFWTEPLRRWLDDQPETSAEKLLHDIAERWHHHPRRANLPSLAEYFLIRRVRHRNSREASLMKAAHKHFLRLMATAVAGIAAITYGAFRIQARQYQQFISSASANSLLELPPVPSWLRPVEIDSLKQRLGSLPVTDAVSRIPHEIRLLQLQATSQPQTNESVGFLLANLKDLQIQHRDDLVHTLQLHRQAVLSLIEQTNQSLLTTLAVNPQQSGEQHQEAARQLAGLAVVAMFLDSPETAIPAATPLNGDCSVRSQFIAQLKDWLESVGLPESLRFEHLHQQTTVTSAVLTALDGQHQTSPIARQIANNARHNRAAAVHFAANYLLESGIASDLNSIPANSNWWIDTVSKVALVETEIPTSSGSLLTVSATEITWGQIRNVDKTLLPESLQTNTERDNLPATDLAADAIFRFINQMNARYAFPETYRRNPENKWEPNPDAHGFRLPTLNEFRQIAFAVETPNRALGQHLSPAFYSSQLPLYANVIEGKAELFARPSLNAVASKRPNPFGLFDLLGNACEIVVDERPPELDRSMLLGDRVALCGVGSDYLDDWSYTLVNRNKIPYYSATALNNNTLGFRIVCDRHCRPEVMAPAPAN